MMPGRSQSAIDMRTERASNDKKRNKIPKSGKMPRKLGRRRGGAISLTPVDEVKHRQQERHAHKPHQPAVARPPPKRNAFQKADQQRRVANGRQTSAGIGHDKYEKNHVMGRD